MSETPMASFFERIEAIQDNAYAEDAKKTEFKSSALQALAKAESASDSDISTIYTQKAIAYSILELARVTGKPTPKK